MVADAMPTPPQFLKSMAALAVALWPSSRPWFIGLKFRLYGQRIDRNQWSAEFGGEGDYQKLVSLSWAQTKQMFPAYFKLLEPAVLAAHGRVLEFGCGNGNMTRWLSQSEAVQSVLAVDAFEDALKQVRAANLRKVEVLRAEADALVLPAPTQFDTVIMTELIEHLYPDEEQHLLQSIRPQIANGARFVVSTPIGWMADRCHVRGFSKSAFRRHLARHYGTVESVDFASGYSQLAVGTFNALKS